MKFFKHLAIAAMALMLPGLTGCKDTIADLIPLTKTEGTVDVATFCSLTMQWGKVEGARQYSYTLTKNGSSDILHRDVTHDNRVTFTDLEYDTEYRLEVLAYSAMGSAYTTSEPIVIIARTPDLTTMQTPTNVSVTSSINTVVVSWDEVQGASDYAYKVTNSKGDVVKEGTTTATSFQIPGMVTDTYALTLITQIDVAGYRNSKPYYGNFSHTRVREQIWEVETVYTSSLLDKSWPVTVVAYDDQSYTVKNWYGVEGKNLEFKLDLGNANDMFKINGSYTAGTEAGSYVIPTGLETPANVTLTCANNQSMMTGNAGKGDIQLKVSANGKSGVDTIQWGLTFEELLGNWTMNFVGEDPDPDYGMKMDETQAITITKGAGENTIQLVMPKFYGSSNNTVTATVDLSTLTISIAPFVEGGGYTVAGSESSSANVIGTISANKIKITSLGLWYGAQYLADGWSLEYTK